MLRPFVIHRPDTLAEAAALAAREGSEAALYAGGTELLPILKERLLRVRSLIDLKRIPRLADITVDDGTVVIGATVTHRSLERSPLVQGHTPLVARVARHVANVRVRNVGTVGGNLAFADPHSDLATLFLVFDGVVRLAGPASERACPLGDFVHGPYETARREDEVLAGIRLRRWPERTFGAYLKFGMYERPTLAVAIALMLDATGNTVADARIAVGCVGPRPRRFTEAERRATGWPVAELSGVAEDIAGLVAEACNPVSDRHGGADYKREMSRVHVRRALDIGAARATGRTTRERYAHTVVA